MRGSSRHGGGGSYRQQRGFMRPGREYLLSSVFVADDSADRPRTGPLVFEERQTEQPTTSGDSFSAHNNPYASLSIQSQRSRLPIFKVCSWENYLLDLLVSKFDIAYV